jgi:hypothetical protein
MDPLDEIRERVIWVINEAIGTAHKYPYLEKRTGISARKWKNVCNRVQQPSIEMLAALAKEFRPLYLEWMVHGEVISSQQINPEEERLDDGSYAHPLLRGEIRTLNDAPHESATEEIVEEFFRPLEAKRARRKQ